MAFIFSALTVSLLLILVAVELYPVLIISTLDPNYNITIYNAASSDKALGIMLHHLCHRCAACDNLYRLFIEPSGEK